MYEASITELFETELGGGKAGVVCVLQDGAACEGLADIVGADGRTVSVVVRQVMFGLHRVAPDARVSRVGAGDVLTFVVDTPVEAFAWAIGGSIRGPASA